MYARYRAPATTAEPHATRPSAPHERVNGIQTREPAHTTAPPTSAYTATVPIPMAAHTATPTTPAATATAAHTPVARLASLLNSSSVLTGSASSPTSRQAASIRCVFGRAQRGRESLSGACQMS